ncbi:hypothetical protein FJTKL_10894 [Diaporthe vaccinii]|uniref:Uncharacterized protein n=1 Tax=Diaporthe vaccinii TaxID=105482 RepID=A0ABR4FCR3_9PEZI
MRPSRALAAKYGQPRITVKPLAKLERGKYLHDGLGSDPLDLLAPAGALCLAGDGQALEWVRLKRPCHVAHCAHHGELPGSLCLGGGTEGGAGDDGRHIGRWRWRLLIKTGSVLWCHWRVSDSTSGERVVRVCELWYCRYGMICVERRLCVPRLGLCGDWSQVLIH